MTMTDQPAERSSPAPDAAGDPRAPDGTPATEPGSGPAETTPPGRPAATGSPPAGSTFESLAVVAFVFGLFAMVAAVFAVGLAARAVDQANDAGSATTAEAPAAEGVATSEVSLVDFAIEPPDLTIPADTVLQVANDGAVVHNLAVDNVSSDMFDPGANGELDLTGLAPGTYTMICEVPGHEAAGMTGTIVIE
jgi:nitrite reductase (NO-forming)